MNPTAGSGAAGAIPVDGRPARWDRWQPWLLGVAAVLSGGVVANWVLWVVPSVRVLLGGSPGPQVGVVIGSPVVHELVTLAAAGTALGCVILADGVPAAGLEFGSWPWQLRTLGHYLTGPLAGIALGTVAVSVLILSWAPATTAVGGQDLILVSHWYLLLTGLTAAICEEIIVVAVAYRLLEYAPGPSGRCLADTGIGTALLVGLRLSYHAYHGVMALALLPWAWLTVRLYRHTRSLPPLIAGHALFYILTPLSFTPRYAVLVAIGVVLLTLTTGLTSRHAFGFGANGAAT